MKLTALIPQFLRRTSTTGNNSASVANPISVVGEPGEELSETTGPASENAMSDLEELSELSHLGDDEEITPIRATISTSSTGINISSADGKTYTLFNIEQYQSLSQEQREKITDLDIKCPIEDFATGLENGTIRVPTNIEKLQLFPTSSRDARSNTSDVTDVINSIRHNVGIQLTQQGVQAGKKVDVKMDMTDTRFCLELFKDAPELLGTVESVQV